MDELSAFERRLAAGLEAYAGPRRSVDADGIARLATSRLPLRRSILLHLVAVAPSPRVAWRATAMVALVAVLALALAASVAIVASRPRRLPAVVDPAGNGLIAYAHAGDIFVGDPLTGTTTAIVTGPEVDSSPAFSPDGAKIAFVRGDAWTDDVSIVVVRADGSDERVAMPSGFSERGVRIAWTPDSAWLVANVDTLPLTTPYFDGELALLDASGLAEPRLLTPPLPTGPGGPYFRNTDPYAPMFRPPQGDAVLTTDVAATRPAGTTPLYAWDGDLTRWTRIVPVGLQSVEPYYFQPWALRWSPDGSMIAALLGWGEPRFDLAVMNADGSGARLLEGASDGPWSPDGSQIAFQRCLADATGDRSVIVIVDVATGAQRELVATDVATKYEGNVSPGPSGWCGWTGGPDGRAWDYEGWSWSPDGRSIMVLERSGTRPKVVDIETGEARELPWEADSPPSWQSVSSR